MKISCIRCVRGGWMSEKDCMISVKLFRGMCEITAEVQINQVHNDKLQHHITNPQMQQ